MTCFYSRSCENRRDLFLEGKKIEIISFAFSIKQKESKINVMLYKIAKRYMIHR